MRDARAHPEIAAEIAELARIEVVAHQERRQAFADRRAGRVLRIELAVDPELDDAAVVGDRHVRPALERDLGRREIDARRPGLHGLEREHQPAGRGLIDEALVKARRLNVREPAVALEPDERKEPALLVRVLGPAPRDRRVLVRAVAGGIDPRLHRDTRRVHAGGVGDEHPRLDRAGERAGVAESPEVGVGVEPRGALQMKRAGVGAGDTAGFVQMPEPDRDRVRDRRGGRRHGVHPGAFVGASGAGERGRERDRARGRAPPEPARRDAAHGDPPSCARRARARASDA